MKYFKILLCICLCSLEMPTKYLSFHFVVDAVVGEMLSTEEFGEFYKKNFFNKSIIRKGIINQAMLQLSSSELIDKVKNSVLSIFLLLNANFHFEMPSYKYKSLISVLNKVSVFHISYLENSQIFIPRI